jgi:hypothetical protein
MVYGIEINTIKVRQTIDGPYPYPSGLIAMQRLYVLIPQAIAGGVQTPGIPIVPAQSGAGSDPNRLAILHPYRVYLVKWQGFRGGVNTERLPGRCGHARRCRDTMLPRHLIRYHAGQENENHRGTAPLYLV